MTRRTMENELSIHSVDSIRVVYAWIGMYSLSTNVFRGVQYLLSHFEAPPNYTIVRSINSASEECFLPLVYSWFEVDRSLAHRCVCHSRTSPFRLALVMWQLAHLSRWSRGPIESFNRGRIGWSLETTDVGTWLNHQLSITTEVRLFRYLKQHAIILLSRRSVQTSLTSEFVTCFVVLCNNTSEWRIALKLSLAHQVGPYISL